MVKLLIILAIVVVAFASTCWSVNKICNTIDGNKTELHEDHCELAKDHDRILQMQKGTHAIAVSNNEMLTYIFNSLKNQNPDLKR